MSRKSAGLLLFRETPAGPLGPPSPLSPLSPLSIEVLLVHPGGPYWAKKDAGAWSIPKGEFSDDEDPLAAATREFQEEMGHAVVGSFLALEPLKQPSGKQVFAWAVCADFDPSALKSNMFSIEWPPKSGLQQQFPEVDRAAWFDIDAARQKILKGQAPFLEQLLTKLGDTGLPSRRKG